MIESCQMSLTSHYKRQQMKKVILLTWNLDGSYGKPFGIFTSKDEMNMAIAAAADTIGVSFENLKLDLYYYELPVNKLVDTDLNIIFS